jgi:hypothetical protein
MTLLKKWIVNFQNFRKCWSIKSLTSEQKTKKIQIIKLAENFHKILLNLSIYYQIV